MFTDFKHLGIHVKSKRSSEGLTGSIQFYFHILKRGFPLCPHAGSLLCPVRSCTLSALLSTTYSETEIHHRQQGHPILLLQQLQRRRRSQRPGPRQGQRPGQRPGERPGQRPGQRQKEEEAQEEVQVQVQIHEQTLTSQCLQERPPDTVRPQRPELSHCPITTFLSCLEILGEAEGCFKKWHFFTETQMLHYKTHIVSMLVMMVT